MRYAWGVIGAVLISLAFAAGAVADVVAPPPGPAPLRYRDPIFPTLTVTRALTYGSAPDQLGNPVTLTLDMFRPANDRQTRRPAIVLVHGGSFTGGNSRNGAMVKMARAFAQRGYVAVSINYRLFGQKGEKCGTEAQPSSTCLAGALAAQHDAQAAVRWLRRYARTYGVDPARIAIGGGSAGAAAALAVAVNSGDPGTSGNPGFSSKVGAAISISGALPGSYAKSLFDRSDSPVLMFEGTVDTVVPYSVAAQTASELRAAGISVVFEALPGGGHVPMKTFGEQIISQSVLFAYDRLDLAHAAGQPPLRPVLSRLTVAPRRFRAATRRGPSLVRSGGARISYRDTESARTRFEVYRLAAHGRLIALGSFTHQDRAGSITLHFSGRLRGRALAPGHYALKATGTLSRLSSRTLRADFQILAPARRR